MKQVFTAKPFVIAVLVLVPCSCRSFDQRVASQARDVAPEVARILELSGPREVRATVARVHGFPEHPAAYDPDRDVLVVDPRLEGTGTRRLRYAIAHGMCHAFVRSTRWEELDHASEEGLCDAVAHIVAPRADPPLPAAREFHQDVVRRRFGLGAPHGPRSWPRVRAREAGATRSALTGSPPSRREP